MRHPGRRLKSIGAKATGVLAVGAVAIGALAIGALTIGRLAVVRARIRRIEIDDLVVRRLHVTEILQGPNKSEAERCVHLEGIGRYVFLDIGDFAAELFSPIHNFSGSRTSAQMPNLSYPCGSQSENENAGVTPGQVIQ